MNDSTIDINEIKKQLNEITSDSKATDKIINQFWYIDAYSLILSIPDYLEIYKQFIKKKLKKGEEVPYRNQFYKYLSKELLKFYNSTQRRKIKQIAFQFEKLQKNEISLPLFKELKKPLNVNNDTGKFAEKFSNLFEISASSDDRDSEEQSEKVIKFRHHTIQEYFAAQEIKKFKTSKRTWEKIFISLGIFKNIDELDLKVISPSWSNTLLFLLDDPKVGSAILDVLLKRLKENPDTIEEQISTMLVLISRKLSKEQKERIYNLIFNQYQKKKKIWFPMWVAGRLHNFITDINSELDKFKKILSRKEKGIWDDYFEKGNLILILENILDEQGIKVLGEKKKQSEWKEILIKNTLYKYDNSVLQRRAIIALKHFRDSSVIEKIKEVWKSDDALIVRNLIELTGEIGADNPKYVKSYILEAIKGDHEIYGRHALYNVKSKESIRTVLEEFNDFTPDEKIPSPSLLYNFLDKEDIFNSEEEIADRPLIKNISSHFKDKDILNLTKGLIWKALKIYRINVRHSLFLRELAKSIYKADPQYWNKLLTKISQEAEDESFNIAYNSWFFFSGMIDLNNVDSFIDKVKKSGIDNKNKYFTESVIRNAAKSHPEKWKKKIKELEDAGIISILKPDKKDDCKENQELVKEFEKYVDEKRVRAFRFYSEHRKLFDQKAKKAVKKLKGIVAELLDKYDTKKVEYHKLKDGRVSSTGFLQFYADILIAANDLGINLTPYRENIIHFIPFAYMGDQELIIKILGKVKDEELKSLNEILLDEKNGIRYSHPSSYIYITSELKDNGSQIQSPAQVLMSYAEDKKIDIYERISALEELKKFKVTDFKGRIKEIFNNYEDSKVYTQKMQLAEQANEILISEFEDQKAIEWRFNQIIERKAKLPKRAQGKGYTPTPLEDEINTLKFANSIVKISPVKYSYFFYKLFFSIFQEENVNTPYSSYILNVIMANFFAQNKYVKKQSLLSLLIALKDLASKHPEFQFYYSRIQDEKIRSGTELQEVIERIVEKRGFQDEDLSETELESLKIHSRENKVKFLKTKFTPNHKNRLRAGNSNNKKYVNICQELLEKTLDGDMQKRAFFTTKEQNSAEMKGSSKRPDLYIPNVCNKENSFFGEIVKDKFNSDFITFECKNYSKETKIDRSDISQIQNYLSPVKSKLQTFGQFGIVFSRYGTKVIRDIYRLSVEGYCIIVLNDNDICKWIDTYIKEGSVESFFRKKYGAWANSTRP